MVTTQRKHVHTPLTIKLPEHAVSTSLSTHFFFVERRQGIIKKIPLLDCMKTELSNEFCLIKVCPSYQHKHLQHLLPVRDSNRFQRKDAVLIQENLVATEITSHLLTGIRHSALHSLVTEPEYPKCKNSLKQNLGETRSQCWKIRVQFPTGAKISLFATPSTLALKVTQFPIQLVSKSFFLGGKTAKALLREMASEIHSDRM
jgi:hypothetical protein